MLVAEVQTPSDTTFRVFDFNRVDPSTGKSHAARRAGDAVHRLHRDRCAGQAGADVHDESVSRLVASPYFHMERARLPAGERRKIAMNGPSVWIMLEGEAEATSDGAAEPTFMVKGDTILFPAAIRNPVVTTRADSLWLHVTFPTR